MKVFLTSEAEKQLQKLPPAQRKKVEKKLLVLEQSPLAGKKLSGEYVMTRSLKVWPYRIIYTDKKDVVVLSILHQQGAYK